MGPPGPLAMRLPTRVAICRAYEGDGAGRNMNGCAWARSEVGNGGTGGNLPCEDSIGVLHGGERFS